MERLTDRNGRPLYSSTEGWLQAIGILLIIGGIVGPGMGIPTVPGGWRMKLLVTGITLGIVGLGAGLLWLSTWLYQRRVYLKRRVVGPPPIYTGHDRRYILLEEALERIIERLQPHFAHPLGKDYAGLPLDEAETMHLYQIVEFVPAPRLLGLITIGSRRKHRVAQLVAPGLSHPTGAYDLWDEPWHETTRTIVEAVVKEEFERYQESVFGSR
ncbi:hypothetical protein HY375_04045 [Candidatus Berkelbacteria bacterium]|nr:hypothetical protein [Candidatus Berkelbacteria bacterium]